MFVRSFRSRMLASAALLAFCPLVSTNAALAASAPTQGTLSSDTLDAQPPSTEITLPSGRKATIAMLKLEHTARLARLANAVPPGNATPPPKAIVRNFSGLGYAADYASFCNAAKATVCLYLPGPGEYLVEHGTVEDFDFFMTQGQCSQYQGTWTQKAPGGAAGSSHCTLTYPESAKIHFDAGLPPNIAVLSSTCMHANDTFDAGFKGQHDPHGYFEVFFNQSVAPIGLIAVDVPKTMSCVTQITTP